MDALHALLPHLYSPPATLSTRPPPVYIYMMHTHTLSSPPSLSTHHRDLKCDSKHCCLSATMTDKSMSSSRQSSKKNQGKTSRVSKAEREKMKREHLNDLFLALANALEIPEQANGKACIIGETTRMVKDTLKQIECLKKENEALLFESQYVTSENNELQVENSAMQDQIVKLQKELKEKMSQVNLDLNIAPPEPKRLDLMPLTAEDQLTFSFGEPMLQQPPSGTPVYVIPVSPDFQVHQQPNHTAQLACRPVGSVSKPHARYPSPGDSWPSRIL